MDWNDPEQLQFAWHEVRNLMRENSLRCDVLAQTMGFKSATFISSPKVSDDSSRKKVYLQIQKIRKQRPDLNRIECKIHKRIKKLYTQKGWWPM